MTRSARRGSLCNADGHPAHRAPASSGMTGGQVPGRTRAVDPLDNHLRIRPTFVKSLAIRAIMSAVARFRFQIVAQRFGSAKSIMMMFGMNDLALRRMAVGG